MAKKNRLISINITKAKVIAISLKYKANQLEYSAEVGLISEYDKPITSVYIGNDAWEESKRAELTLKTIDIANQLREEIEISVIRKMNSMQKILECKTE